MKKVAKGVSNILKASDPSSLFPASVKESQHSKISCSWVKPELNKLDVNLSTKLGLVDLGDLVLRAS